MATIEAAFDIDVLSVEGHDGIYEVTVDAQVIYTNYQTCSQGFPKDWDIVEKVGRFLGLEPRGVEAGRIEGESAPAAACALPHPSADESV